MARKTRKNNLTSPELIAQVNPDNIRLMNDFIEYMRSTDISESTIAAYTSDLYIAFVWSLQKNNNKFFVEWTKRDVMSFQGWLLNENENSPARIRRLKASLSSLSNFIESILDDEYPGFRNIMNKVKAPVNQPVREKTVLTDDQVDMILRMLLDKNRIMCACYVALAAYGGRRKSEILRFRVSDFDDSRLVCGGSLYKSEPIKTKGRGKGKFICCYTLAHKFRPYLDLWMAEREKNGIESEWLFPGDDPAEHAEISLVNSWMTSISRITGLDVYAHSFRHYFTTMLSKEGLPDSVIKEIQHWESLEMVSIYNDSTTEEALEEYFGEEGIKKKNSKGLADL